MPYKTNSDFVPIHGEYNDPRTFGKFVETLGYKTVKQQIESFSPQASNEVGDMFYDFASGNDDPEYDSSFRFRDMDLAEVGQEIARNEKRLTASARQAQAIQDKVDDKTGSGTEQKPVENS